MRLTVTMLFNAHGKKETKNLFLPDFNGHADDKKSVRRAAMKEAKAKGWQTNHVQGVWKTKPNIKGEIK